jgi:hypothetical protein
MGKERTLVRASEIGLWGFCQRAWWLAIVKEVAHQNPAVLARGVEAHRAHGQHIHRAQLAQQVGLLLIALSMIIGGLLFLFR